MRRFEEMDKRTAQEYLERYVESLSALRARFARRLEVTGGPQVDLSVAALRELDPWYERQIVDPAPDGGSGVPLWWEHHPAFQVSDNQLRLVDDVGAHLAAVLQNEIPTATWVVRLQPGGRRTLGHHESVLQMGS